MEYRIIGTTLEKCICKEEDINAVIPKGVSTIGYEAFMDMTELVSVVIPDGLKEIKACAFCNCSSLRSITIPDSVTKIEAQVFAGCISLEEIRLPNGLEIVDCGLFEYCEKLSNIYIPDSVRIIEHEAFVGCKSLKSIYIPKGVERLCLDAFKCCYALEMIEISQDNQYYSSCNGMIFNKDKTELIASPPANKNVVIPEGVKMLCDYALSYNPFTKSIYIPASVIGLEISTFTECKNLDRIDVDENNAFFTSYDGAVYSKDMANLIVCPFGKKKLDIPEGVINIVERACFSCRLVSVTCPSTLKRIGHSAFACCKNFEHIDIPKSVTRIEGYSFFGTKWLSRMRKQDRFVTVNGILIDACSLKGDVVIPLGVEVIGEESFVDCSSVHSITLSDTVTCIEELAFCACINLQSLRLSASVSCYNSNCVMSISDLKQIIVDQDNNVFCSVNGVLYSKDKKTLIHCPSGRKTLVVPEGVEKIDDDAFQYCDSLMRLSLPDSLDLSNGIRVFDFLDYLDSPSCEFRLYCGTGSSSERFAREYGINYETR